MSEHEISKHTKAIYKVWSHPGLSWKQKLREVIIEIFIIVFAISLSLLVERWRENKHERTIEKEFLTGLRIDLKNDLEQENRDSLSYARILQAWRYFRMEGIKGDTVHTDSIRKYIGTLMDITSFIPNNSRYEGLKSSGQLGVIRDQEILNLMLDLYQYKIKSLALTTDFINQNRTNFMIPYIQEKLVVHKDNKTNLQQLFLDPKMQNYLIIGESSQGAMERYGIVMVQTRKIIQLIDREYPGD
jgi:hypothetical protein